MKRDPDLMRKILLALEESDNAVSYRSLDVPPHSAEAVSYHLMLMNGAGLVDAQRRVMAKGPLLYAVRSLTMQGHDFLDAIRSDTVWEKVKKKVASAAESAGIATLSDLMGRSIKGLIGGVDP